MARSVRSSLATAPPAPTAFPPLPFASPDQPDARLQDFLEQASERLCAWLGSASQRSPLPGLSVLPEVEPGRRGLDPASLLADLQLVMDGAYNPSHPGALAHLDPPPLPASIAADLICAGLNNNLLAEELSPSLSRLERSLASWLAGQLGLGDGSGGVVASGGTLANLMALVTARSHAGLGCHPGAVVVASADAHVSLDKAVRVMGLPPSALRRIPTGAEGGLDVAVLDATLQQLQAAGVPVIAVVATAGTTVRGAVDPLRPIAALCRRYGLWLHVDGAIGAVFALSPRHRHRVVGLGEADSVTINPQKLLGITKTSSLLLLRRPDALEQAFGTGLPYMEPSWGGGHGGERGLQGTRPADILKLWLGLRQLGLEGIEAVLDGAIERRRALQALLAPLPGLDLSGGSFHLLAFTLRHGSVEQTEHWSRSTRQQLLDHQVMLSRPLHGGRHHLKAVLGNPHTTGRELRLIEQVVAASLPSPFSPTHDS